MLAQQIIRSEADLAGNGAHGQIRLLQETLGLADAKVVEPSKRRCSEIGGEPAVKGARGHGAGSCEFLDVPRPPEVLADHQMQLLDGGQSLDGEAGIRILGLRSRPAYRGDHCLRDRFRGAGSPIQPEQMQQEINSCRDTGRCPNLVPATVQIPGPDLDFRMPQGKLFGEAPVGRRCPSVKQASGGQRECSGAQRGNKRSGSRCSCYGGEFLGSRGCERVDAARDYEDVELVCRGECVGAPHRMERIKIGDGSGREDADLRLGQPPIRAVIVNFARNFDIKGAASRAHKNSHDGHGVILSNHVIHATGCLLLSMMK